MFVPVLMAMASVFMCSRVIWPELGVSRVTGLIGQSWYGGDALARWGEVQVSQVVRQGDAAQLTFGSVVRAEKRLDDDINSNRSLSLSVDRAQVVGDGIGKAFELAVLGFELFDQPRALFVLAAGLGDVAHDRQKAGLVLDLDQLAPQQAMQWARIVVAYEVGGEAFDATVSPQRLHH